MSFGPYSKFIIAAVGAVGLTVAWAVGAPVPTEVVAGAWVVVAGVFGVKNA